MKKLLNSTVKWLVPTVTVSLPVLTQAQVEDDMLFADIPSVFTASKYEQKASDAPARISVITAEEIQRYGYRDLAEALQSLPGIQYSYDHNYTYLGVRGVNIPGDFNSRVLILIDGHRVNENIYDGAIIDQGALVSLDLIKQIEMIRGPASSLYGSSAFLGVINIITKDGRDLDGVEVAADTGSFDTHQGRVSYGKQYSNGLEVLVSANGYRSDGDDRYFAEFDDPATNNGVAEKDTDEGDQQGLFAKLRYGDLTISAGYSDYEKHIPTASYETVFNDDRTQTTEGHSYINLSYQTLLANGADVTVKLFYDSYWYDGVYMDDYPPVTAYIDEGRGEWWGTEGQFSKVIFDGHRLTAGFEYRETLKAEQHACDVFATYLDIDTERKVYGVFLQDEWQLNEQWMLNLGLRYDDYSESKSSTNPRLAAIWQPGEGRTVKFLYGTAFRAPNAYELFYYDGFAQKAAGMLDPETIESYEVIWEQQINTSLRLISSLYQNNYDDIIILVTDPNDGFEVFDNREDVESQGIELELVANFSGGWSGSLSYSYQDVEFDDGEEAVNYAPNIAKFNALSPLIAEHFLLGLELQYEDGRKTLAGPETDSILLTNLTVSNTTAVKGLTLSASVYNLFDEAFAHPGFQEHVQNELAQDERTYRLKATYRF